MTDEEDSDIERRGKALIEKFLAFLTEHGVDLYHDEPEPVLDEFIAVYMSGVFTHLTHADDITRHNYALEAYSHAYAARLNRVNDSKVSFMLAASIATQCSILHEFALMDGLSPAEYSEQQADLRTKLVAHLWMRELWCEPWISLVNQELPGPEPTADDIERFKSYAIEQAARDDQLHNQLMEIVSEMELFLAERGYLVEAEDNLLIVKLASIPMIWSRLNGANDSAKQAPIIAELFAMGVSREDPVVWTEFIDHFFPISQGDDADGME